MRSPQYSASSYYSFLKHELSLASRVCDRNSLMYGHAGCRDDTSLWDEDPEVKNTNNHSLTLLPQKITRLPLVPGGPHTTPASQAHLGTHSCESDITESYQCALRRTATPHHPSLFQTPQMIPFNLVKFGLRLVRSLFGPPALRGIHG